MEYDCAQCWNNKEHAFDYSKRTIASEIEWEVAKLLLKFKIIIIIKKYR